ncbi:hypothetical protein CYMTET_38561, partial [Cymbomonas tetramitiformis]
WQGLWQFWASTRTDRDSSEKVERTQGEKGTPEPQGQKKQSKAHAVPHAASGEAVPHAASGEAVPHAASGEAVPPTQSKEASRQARRKLAAAARGHKEPRNRAQVGAVGGPAEAGDGARQEKPGQFRPEMFDALLLDAPCSAMGLRPRLEMGMKMPELESTAAYQRKMLSQAVHLLKPNCYMVYSTCTINPGENEANVRYVLDKFPCLKLVAADPIIGNSGLCSRMSDDGLNEHWLSPEESLLKFAVLDSAFIRISPVRQECVQLQSDFHTVNTSVAPRKVNMDPRKAAKAEVLKADLWDENIITDVEFEREKEKMFSLIDGKVCLELESCS